MQEKPYSESCDQNREPILAVLRPALASCRTLLEIGSGTGQHAVYFAAALPGLRWQCSDRAASLPGMRLWLTEADLANLPPPLALDVADPAAWPEGVFDAVFSANTAHIMHWPEVEALFAGVAAHLAPGGRFLLYGPFHRDGRPTAPSNARFDAWLRARDPAMGVRDQGELEALGARVGLRFDQAYPMPADNAILSWRRDAEATAE